MDIISWIYAIGTILIIAAVLIWLRLPENWAQTKKTAKIIKLEPEEEVRKSITN